MTLYQTFICIRHGDVFEINAQADTASEAGALALTHHLGHGYKIVDSKVSQCGKLTGNVLDTFGLKAIGTITCEPIS